MKYISSHQPDFAPWLGLFIRIKMSEIFLVEMSDYLTPRGFGRRVVLDEGYNLQVPALKSKLTYEQTPLDEGKFDELVNRINGYYASHKKEMRDTQGRDIILNMLNHSFLKCDNVADFNLMLLKLLLNYYKIDTRIEISRTPPEIVGGGERVQYSLDLIDPNREYRYLSGIGLLNYADKSTFTRPTDIISIYAMKGKQYTYSIFHLLMRDSSMSFDDLVRESYTGKSVETWK